jgi:endonuclease YncB( thermonuclease family)
MKETAVTNVLFKKSKNFLLSNLCIFIATAYSIGSVGSAELRVFAGIPIVIDGDTLRIKNEKIRLEGVDAVEQKQTCMITKSQKAKSVWQCGKKATEALTNKVRGKEIRCYSERRDSYKRIVATCELEGENLNRWLVSNGWAVAYSFYTTAYVPEEVVAKREQKGVWGGVFEQPRRYRESKVRVR